MGEEIKEYQDSFTVGTPAKGGGLKVYFDLSNVDETQKKLENFIKTRIYLQGKGFME